MHPPEEGTYGACSFFGGPLATCARSSAHRSSTSCPRAFRPGGGAARIRTSTTVGYQYTQPVPKLTGNALGLHRVAHVVLDIVGADDLALLLGAGKQLVFIADPVGQIEDARMHGGGIKITSALDVAQQLVLRVMEGQAVAQANAVEALELKGWARTKKMRKLGRGGGAKVDSCSGCDNPTCCATAQLAQVQVAAASALVGPLDGTQSLWKMRSQPVQATVSWCSSQLSPQVQSCRAASFSFSRRSMSFSFAEKCFRGKTGRRGV